jgi:hypothetical protein
LGDPSAFDVSTGGSTLPDVAGSVYGEPVFKQNPILLCAWVFDINNDHTSRRLEDEL